MLFQASTSPLLSNTDGTSSHTLPSTPSSGQNDWAVGYQPAVLITLEPLSQSLLQGVAIGSADAGVGTVLQEDLKLSMGERL